MKDKSSLLEEAAISLAKALREGLLLGFVAAALFVAVALLTYDLGDGGWSHSGSGEPVKNAGGTVGAWFADFCLALLGLVSFGIAPWLAFLGYRLFRLRTLIPAQPWVLALRWAGAGAAIVAGAGLAEAHLYRFGVKLPEGSGGIVGQEILEAASAALGEAGSSIVLTAICLGGISLSTHLSWLNVIDRVGKCTLLAVNGVASLLSRRRVAAQDSVTASDSPDAATASFAPHSPAPPTPSLEPGKKKPKTNRRAEPVATETGRSLSIQTYEPTTPVNFSASTSAGLPPLDLLNDLAPKVSGYTPEALEQMSAQVEAILRDFGVDVKVDAVHPGPVITRFELELAPGVKVSRVSGLAKDLARAMLVSSVRVVEIIPGKSVIGLEIPNQQRELVLLRSVLMSEVYQESASPLTLVLGKDISGKPVAANLARMPHLLVAGTTGSGKSVAVNVMILSLLYKAPPEDVRVIMIDPKMLELSVYEGIPHLLTPVVTDMKEAANALRWCVAEMERRYKLMSLLGVRNLDSYNQKVRDANAAGTPIVDPLFRPEMHLEVEAPPNLGTLPFIVIVIDELADMMMIVGKKVEELIARLAQKARAAGLHLILATQRPSVDVITGLIKANIPTRIAFQVSSKIDSRTIIDQGGAEALLGNGDMLYLPPGTGLPVRVHGAFVGDNEVHAVVDFLKRTGRVQYILEITRFSDDSGDASGYSGGSSDGGDEADEYYDDAVRFVTETRKASTSAIQRRFKIGYNRAARIMDEMERAGVVGPAETNGSRTVFAPPPPEL